MRLRENLRAVPLLGVLVAMVGGVLLGGVVDVPLGLWVVGAVACGGLAAFTLHFSSRGGLLRVVPTVYVGAAVVFFGAAMACWHKPERIVPQGIRVWMEVQVEADPVWREGRRSASTDGVAIRWRLEDGEWRPSGERLLVSIDTTWRLALGERVIFRGYVNPIDTVSSGYARLMRSRGFTGRTYISRWSQPRVVGFAERDAGVFFKRLQSAATRRLMRLGGVQGGRSCVVGDSHNTVIVNGSEADQSDFDRQSRRPPSWVAGGAESHVAESSDVAGTVGTKTDLRSRQLVQLSDNLAVAAVMTTGDRSGITPGLRQAYSRTGAAHLLAVSGLHVGIIFLLINALLYLLPFARGGFFVKNVLAVLAIWAYAGLTGLSPSATRAAVMFTGAQLAVGLSVRRSAANILCGTAIIMLAVWPGLVFDIGFQLSFVAVAGIMAWLPMLYELVKSRFKVLNALWGVVMVGVAASVATMPLVSHVFGVFSPLGVVLNPIVIATAHVVVGFSVLWIIAPIGFLAPVFRFLIGGSAWLQNAVIEAVGSVPGVAVEWTLPAWGVVAVYGSMIGFKIWLKNR